MYRAFKYEQNYHFNLVKHIQKCATCNFGFQLGGRHLPSIKQICVESVSEYAASQEHV